MVDLDFGSDVSQRTHTARHFSFVVVHRESKVTQLHGEALLAEQQILQLDVTVIHTLLVEVGDHHQDLLEEVFGGCLRERLPQGRNYVKKVTGSMVLQYDPIVVHLIILLHPHDAIVCEGALYGDLLLAVLHFACGFKFLESQKFTIIFVQELVYVTCKTFAYLSENIVLFKFTTQDNIHFVRYFEDNLNFI